MHANLRTRRNSFLVGVMEVGVSACVRAWARRGGCVFVL